MRPLVLTQTAMADYRDQFVRLLVQRRPAIHIQVGEYYFEGTTRTSDVVLSLKQVVHINNVFINRRRACWQSLHWSVICGASVVVAELNPRLISTWLILLVRAALGRKTVLWGHAWARAGCASRSEILRHCMRLMASGLIFYTNKQRNEFLAKYPMFGRPVSVAPNSLYSASQMSSARVPTIEPSDFIYVGRLVANKKVQVLLAAFEHFAVRNPSSQLHIVGSGDQNAELQAMVRNKGIPNVVFYGHIADIAKLRALYCRSVASVSPGYVGLSITQSFSFGVPMIISRNEPHSPELESFDEGFNGSYFDTDDCMSLCVEMEAWFARRESLTDLAEAIVDRCKAGYSVERMVDGFLEGVDE